MPSKIDKLRTLTVTDLGGMFNEFSQSYAQIKSARTIAGLYTSDKQNIATNATDLYVGGMCHTMSMYWIIGQAGGIGGKKGFLDWIMPTRSSNAINMEAVAVLVSKTVMYKAKGPRAQAMGISHDANFDESFFASNGIKPKNESHTGFDQIKRQIGQRRNRFFMISYGSGAGGHACAAQSTREGGYAYFDPNYGQAALFSLAAWEYWYDAYLMISGYSSKYTNHQSIAGYKAIRDS